MRDVLGHPFFGIGKLAGKAPVFVRPTLGAPHKEETPVLEETPFLIETEKNSAPALSGPGPSPRPPSTISKPKTIVKEPEPTRLTQSAPAAALNPTPAPIPDAQKKSKFGIKGVFGKKK